MDSEAVTTIISHLERSEADIITNLLFSHSLLVHEVLKERKRNRDLGIKFSIGAPIDLTSNNIVWINIFVITTIIIIDNMMHCM